jgi:transcriptional regulator with XRE-family HTH domain
MYFDFDFEATVEYQTSLSAISGYMLLNIRKNLGLGQADMGKLFNMSHATYRSIERGETAINADFIYMLCDIIER